MSLITPQNPQVFAADRMTLAEAQVALARPLKFGDPVQIQAMILVEQLEGAVAAMLKCPHSYARRKDMCSCLESFKPEVLEAATRYDEVRNRKPCWAWEIRVCLRECQKTKTETCRETAR